MLSLFTACGYDDDDSSRSRIQQEQTRQDGNFIVTLAAINPTQAGTAVGTGTFMIDADSFNAKLEVMGAPVGTHIQTIRGRACPTASADANGDNVVDAVEAQNVSGKIIIPLDSNLQTQAGGFTFPSGSNYNYDETAGLAQMLADLSAPDAAPEDSIIKLEAGQLLDLEGRVVLIHGVPAGTVLPPTAVGIDGLSAQASLPILCGVITRTADEEETSDVAAAAASAASEVSAAAASAASAASAATDSTTGGL